MLVRNGLSREIRTALIEDRKTEVMYHVGRSGADGDMSNTAATADYWLPTWPGTELEIESTTQRPKISKNTQTTAEDTIEFEAGLHGDPNDFLDAPVNDSDSVFLELVGSFTEGISRRFLGQAGFYRRIAANMTADAAFGIGLDSDAPAFCLMLGFTTNFGSVR